MHCRRLQLLAAAMAAVGPTVGWYRLIASVSPLMHQNPDSTR
jgi:hypothetical protein